MEGWSKRWSSDSIGSFCKVWISHCSHSAYSVHLCYSLYRTYRDERVLGIPEVVLGLGVEESGKPFPSSTGEDIFFRGKVDKN